jgi:hypothetical protein
MLVGAQVGESTATPATPENTPAATPPPAPAPTLTAEGNWGVAPAPLQGFERYDRAGVIATAPPVALSVPVHCADDDAGLRYVAEGLAALTTATGAGFLGYYIYNSARGGSGWGPVVGVISYLTLTPLAVVGVGGHFRGNGKYWASLLGGLLLPVVGHVVGYELSHTPICTPQERAGVPHPRRFMASQRRSETLGISPWVSPTDTSTGALTGVSVRF